MVIRKVSVSFKEKEIDLWDHLQKQLNASYYIKTLILNDMKKDKVQVTEKKSNKLEIDF